VAFHDALDFTAEYDNPKPSLSACCGSESTGRYLGDRRLERGAG